MLICCLKCIALCGCRDLLLNRYAFFPPKTNSYSLSPSSQDKE